MKISEVRVSLLSSSLDLQLIND